MHCLVQEDLRMNVGLIPSEKLTDAIGGPPEWESNERAIAEEAKNLIDAAFAEWETSPQSLGIYLRKCAPFRFVVLELGGKSKDTGGVYARMAIRSDTGQCINWSTDYKWHIPPFTGPEVFSEAAQAVAEDVVVKYLNAITQ